MESYCSHAAQEQLAVSWCCLHCPQICPKQLGVTDASLTVQHVYVGKVMANSNFYMQQSCLQSVLHST